MTTDLAIVPTGTANLASVVAAFRRIGVESEVATRPELIEGARRVVLPGVGSFGAAIAELDRSGLRLVLKERVDAGRATLAVCVGMQILSTKSEESEGAVGLGSVAEVVTRFPDSVLVPQLGWNEVVAAPGSRFITDGWAYFANSYRLVTAPNGWAAATTQHGGPFVAAMERGDVLTCQFHPELSGAWGSGLLRRWFETTGEAA